MYPTRIEVASVNNRAELIIAKYSYSSSWLIILQYHKIVHRSLLQECPRS